MSEAFQIVPEDASHAGDILRLHRLCFGPGRFAKTTYRLREELAKCAELSFVGYADGQVEGTVQIWPACIGGVPALHLGPLATSPHVRKRGLGFALMKHALDKAAADGHRLCVLVGDMGYYGRAGFQPVPPGQIWLPGPVNPVRLLYKELAPGALDSARGQMTKPRILSSPCAV